MDHNRFLLQQARSYSKKKFHSVPAVLKGLPANTHTHTHTVSLMIMNADNLGNVSLLRFSYETMTPFDKITPEQNLLREFFMPCFSLKNAFIV